jgi:hypothetical protein
LYGQELGNDGGIIDGNVAALETRDHNQGFVAAILE